MNIYFQPKSRPNNISFLDMMNRPAFSRGLRPFTRTDYICSKCLQFSTTTAVSSGHNRWSKIKHDKGAMDAKKTKARSAVAHDIALAVKCMSIDILSTLSIVLTAIQVHGADPYVNPRLATVIATAKKGT